MSQAAGLPLRLRALAVVHSSAMPSVKGIPGAYRFFFYSLDCEEPIHVHVKRERMVCKFWLDPVELARNWGFPQHELNRIQGLIEENMEVIKRLWDEHCNPD
jgi:Domain of unknown function (DUF4160)